MCVQKDDVYSNGMIIRCLLPAKYQAHINDCEIQGKKRDPSASLSPTAINNTVITCLLGGNNAREFC